MSDFRERNAELTQLYATLANDLAQWRNRNERKEPDPDNAPIVWKLHETVGELEDSDEPVDDEKQKAANGFNEVLRTAGIPTRLDQEEAWRLVRLMRVKVNKALRPYEPPPIENAW